MVARKALINKMRYIAGGYLGVLIIVIVIGGGTLAKQYIKHPLLKSVNPTPVTKFFAKLIPIVGILGPVTMLGGMAYLRYSIEKKSKKYQQELVENGQTYIFTPKYDAKKVKVSDVSLWAKLTGILGSEEHISFEVSGSNSHICYSVRAPENMMREILTMVISDSEGARGRKVTKKEDDPVRFVNKKAAGCWFEVRPSSNDLILEPSVEDPLVAILTEIARLPDNVRGGVQILARSDPYSASRLLSKASSLSSQRAPQGQSKSRDQRRLEADLDERSGREFVECRVVAWASAETPHESSIHARSLASNLAAQFRSKGLVLGKTGTTVPVDREFTAFSGYPWADNEIGAIAHLVGSDVRGMVTVLESSPAKPLKPSPACCIPPNAHVIRDAVKKD